MKIKSAVILFLFFFVFNCSGIGQTKARMYPSQSNKNIAARNSLNIETLNLFDKKRSRSVPVTLYSPVPSAGKSKSKLKLAIFNHGYGMKNTEYSFVAETLVARGYVVASIQHELPTDEPLPTTGKPSEVRRPFWERGVQNILFVIEELKRLQPKLDFKNLLLAGHSNGGDMTMLLVDKYPGRAQKIISLDNRRMTIPRVKRPRILSIRSSDQPADEGVLPTPEEQKKFGIKIVKLKNTIHNDMWDGATDEQKSEMRRVISKFLQGR